MTDIPGMTDIPEKDNECKRVMAQVINERVLGNGKVKPLDFRIAYEKAKEHNDLVYDLLRTIQAMYEFSLPIVTRVQGLSPLVWATFSMRRKLDHLQENAAPLTIPRNAGPLKILAYEFCTCAGIGKQPNLLEALERQFSAVLKPFREYIKVDGLDMAFADLVKEGHRMIIGFGPGQRCNDAMIDELRLRCPCEPLVKRKLLVLSTPVDIASAPRMLAITLPREETIDEANNERQPSLSLREIAAHFGLRRQPCPSQDQNRLTPKKRTFIETVSDRPWFPKLIESHNPFEY